MTYGAIALARTAIRAMTTTLVKGCCRLTEERGSSNSSKCRTISATSLRWMLDMVGPLCVVVDEVTHEMYTGKPPRAQALQPAKPAQSARWPWAIGSLITLEFQTFDNPQILAA